MNVHLGCGNTSLPGYVRIDLREGIHPDILANATSLPVRTGVVDVLYCSHLFEHFIVGEAGAVLDEWHRVLAPQTGLLRMSLPDLGALFHLYINEGVHLVRVRGPMYGKQDHPANFHYGGWDYETLAEELRLHGFYNIQWWDPEIVHPVWYDDFSRARINGQLISLNVEAYRGR